MTVLVKINRNGQMTLPSDVRSALGVSGGDVVELSLKRGKAILTPKTRVDRSDFPNADAEYTPAQRRYINARLDEAERGPFYGPFKNGAEVAAFLKERTRPRKPG
jgi:AbrB family looped-hinge helix DNA binding protein